MLMTGVLTTVLNVTRRIDKRFIFTAHTSAGIQQLDIAGAVASITESDPGVQSERGSNNALG
jgi:hypothetical protein